jgi:hypothetical protein
MRTPERPPKPMATQNPGRSPRGRRAPRSPPALVAPRRASQSPRRAVAKVILEDLSPLACSFGLHGASARSSKSRRGTRHEHMARRPVRRRRAPPATCLECPPKRPSKGSRTRCELNGIAHLRPVSQRERCRTSFAAAVCPRFPSGWTRDVGCTHIGEIRQKQLRRLLSPRSFSGTSVFPTSALQADGQRG